MFEDYMYHPRTTCFRTTSSLTLHLVEIKVFFERGSETTLRKSYPLKFRLFSVMIPLIPFHLPCPGVGIRLGNETSVLRRREVPVWGLAAGSLDWRGGGWRKG